MPLLILIGIVVAAGFLWGPWGIVLAILILWFIGQ